MNKQYPKYKPSGVPWLGDVPEVKRTRFMLSINPRTCHVVPPYCVWRNKCFYA